MGVSVFIQRKGEGVVISRDRVKGRSERAAEKNIWLLKPDARSAVVCIIGSQSLKQDMNPDLLYILILFGSMTLVGLLLMAFGDRLKQKR